MELELILKIVSIVLGALCTSIIPLVIKLVAIHKEAKNAKTEAEKEAATNDMLAYVNTLIESAEETYKQVDQLMKNNRLGSMGAVKKDGVMTKLQAYAIENGYPFSADYWANKIDEIVSLTKKVNAK